MKIDYILIGVYILSAVNIIMFFVLLFRKIKIKEKREKDKEKAGLYRSFIRKYVSDGENEILNIKSKRDISIFTFIMLEEINIAAREEKHRLWELSGKMGLTDIERNHLKKGNKSTKAIAAYRLGELGAFEAIDDLLSNIKKNNTELSYIIFRSLVLLSGTEYLDRIIDYFGENNFTVKAGILDLISSIDGEDIYYKMKEYLEGENSLKKVLALESLTNQGDIRVDPYIKRELDSDNKEIKIAALKAVIASETLNCKEVFPAIIHFKDDPEWEIRAFFANALKICSGRKEAVDILKELAQDHHYQVRFNAAERLFEFGEDGLAALSEILYGKDKFAVEKAWSLINREITLYNLMDKIKDYNRYEYIVGNIENYRKSLKGGVLSAAE